MASDAPPAASPPFTVEERLRRAHEQLCLAADLAALQAVAPAAGWPDGLSPAAWAALAAWYRQASRELAATLAGVPPTVLNRLVDDGPVAPRGPSEDQDGGDP